jgi:serine/threonine-protein kinase
MDRIGREAIAFAPDSPHGYRIRADAQSALGASEEAIADLLRQKEARTPERTKARTVALDAIALATWSGRFADAARKADELEAFVEGDTRWMIDARCRKVYALEQAGDRAKAAAAAESFLRRAAAMAAPDQIYFDSTMTLLQTARLGGAIPAQEFEARRAAWEAQWRARIAPGASILAILWVRARALPATSPAEARDAIALLPEYAQPPGLAHPWFVQDNANLGEVYRLAGDLESAARRLEVAARYCSLDAHVDDHLRLGRVRELQGNTAAACAAYAHVLARWGAARPRSIAAEEARARSSQLRCPSTGSSVAAAAGN